jgi:hypothetical protein
MKMFLKEFKEYLKSSFAFASSMSVYLFIIAILLAYFEVQIEGPNGWAGILPTWKSVNPNFTWIFGGRPITGYHVALNLLLISFFHWPLLFSKWSLLFEARTLSSFALLSTVWDFLWFVINPYFGLQKYNATNVWWFKHWLIGIPVDYYFGLLMAIVFRLLPVFFNKEPLAKSLAEGIIYVVLIILLITTFTFIICLIK